MKVQKYSRQREALIKVLKGTTSHPTADWLYQQLREEFPKISLGTVYRNLGLLVESGQAIRINAGDSCEHYDGDTRNHYHFVCRNCKQVSDVDMEPIEELNAIAAESMNSDVESHSLVFFGICQNCRN